MTTVRGRRVPDTTREAVDGAVGELLAEAAPAPGESVLVLVDGSYPYHPSTGYVTDPGTLRAVLDHLDGRDVAVATAGSDGIDPGRATGFLGYDRVAEAAGAELLDLDRADRVDVTAGTVGADGTAGTLGADGTAGTLGADGTAAVPRPMVERTLVVVPTVRRSADWGVEAGCWTLARSLGDVSDAGRLRTAAAVCDPALTLVDAVYVYGDPPASPRLLLAGEDVVATTAAVASLFGAEGTVPHLDGEAARSLTFDGFDPLPVVDLLADTSPRPDGDDRMVAAGYRLYARLTGDLVPPQLLGGDG